MMAEARASLPRDEDTSIFHICECLMVVELTGR